MTLNLPFAAGDDWRYRWECRDSASGWWSDRLHRIAVVTKVRDEDEGVGVEGKSACGLSGLWAMPGLISRMARPRCAHCCDRLGIPRGDGAPFNQGLDA